MKKKLLLSGIAAGALLVFAGCPEVKVSVKPKVGVESYSYSSFSASLTSSSGQFPYSRVISDDGKVNLLVILANGTGDEEFEVKLPGMLSDSKEFLCRGASIAEFPLKELQGLYVVEKDRVMLYKEVLDSEKLEILKGNEVFPYRGKFTLDDILKRLELKSTPVEYRKL